MKNINAKVAGLFATVSVGLSLAMVAPSSMNAKDLRLIGGNLNCRNTGTTKCFGALPDTECGDITSTTCDMLGTVPNGTTTCKNKNNQSNACGGGPQFTCLPPDMMCF
jgi:hypothetical protein